MPHLMLSTRVERGIVLDPRTKVIVLIVVSCVLLTSDNSLAESIARFIMLMLPFVFILVSGRPVAATIFFLVYLLSNVLTYFLAYMPAFLGTFVMANCMVVGRFLPTVATGYFIMTTTTVSEFMAGMRRMHLPNAVTIPLSVLFRFFPTLLEEIRSINAAMKMRDIRLSSAGILPMIEYRMVPLMACAVSIGDDLSASALSRGLGSPLPRTDICQIGLHIQDILILALCAASAAIMALGWIGVPLP